MKYLFSLIILCPFFAFAQGNYKPGYVVTLKGDTIHGFINYKDWNKNPRQVEFKNNLSIPKSTIYSATNTDAFGVTGYEYYKRYTGKISQDVVETTYLSRGMIDTATKTDTVFLRAISNGKNITLYEYADIIKERYFIAPKNAPAEELSFHVYFTSIDATKVDRQRGYMQQLQSLATIYAPQNTTIAEEISNTEYTSDGLKKIVAEINGTNGTSTSGSLFAGENHSSTRLFIGVGANSTMSSFTGNIDFASLPSYSSIFPAITIGADVFFNKNVGTLLLRTSLNFTGSKTDFTYTSTGIAPYRTIFKFNQYTATLNPQLLYNIYNTDPFKFYIAAGPAANFSIYNGKQYSRTNNINTNPTPGSLDTQPLTPQSLFISFTSKIGIVLNNKLDIYLGYVPGYTVDFEESYALRGTSYSAGINLLFGK